jgi:tetratricopeptide (TPR) repeat protein
VCASAVPQACFDVPYPASEHEGCAPPWRAEFPGKRESLFRATCGTLPSVKQSNGKRGAANRPPMHPQQTERFHSAIRRLMAGQDFKSPEELNKFLQEQLAAGALEWDALGPGPAASALEQAQELVFRALDAPSRGQRVKMAKEAISLSEDCADAWLLLAKEHASTAAERITYIRKALAAAESALGPEAFREYRGRFWDFPETRPYMRAREMLADALATSGKKEEAVAHWEEMLELNPHDNQGIRLRLLLAYLESGAQEKAATLFERFPDDATCEMMYGRVIYQLAAGRQTAARQALRRALRINRHVPDFLLGRRPIPRRRPEMITWGGEDEAGLYALDHLKLWRDTAGARELLSAAR